MAAAVAFTSQAHALEPLTASRCVARFRRSGRAIDQPATLSTASRADPPASPREATPPRSPSLMSTARRLRVRKEHLQ